MFKHRNEVGIISAAHRLVELSPLRFFCYDVAERYLQLLNFGFYSLFTNDTVPNDTRSMFQIRRSNCRSNLKFV